MNVNTHPLLFSDDMVRALLDGRKTQTRRIIKLQPTNGGNPKRQHHDFVHSGFLEFADDGFCAWQTNGWHQRCPYGVPGDLLWVRECCAWPDQGKVFYRSDPETTKLVERLNKDKNAPQIKWRPSIFMFRWMSRITLRIKDVRVEQLQKISGTDAIAEGLCRHAVLPVWMASKENCEAHIYPAHAYRDLWESINGADSWAKNPWVWVLEFEVIKEKIDNVLEQS